MSNQQKAQKIKNDLEKRFNRARFKVTVKAGGDVTVDFLGGHDYKDEYPTYAACVREMTRIIRKTIPNFEWLDYQTREGETIYAG